MSTPFFSSMLDVSALELPSNPGLGRTPLRASQVLTALTDTFLATMVKIDDSFPDPLGDRFTVARAVRGCKNGTKMAQLLRAGALWVLRVELFSKRVGARWGWSCGC